MLGSDLWAGMIVLRVARFVLRNQLSRHSVQLLYFPGYLIALPIQSSAMTHTPTAMRDSESLRGIEAGLALL